MHETYFGRKSVPINVNLDTFTGKKEVIPPGGSFFFYIIDSVDMFWWDKKCGMLC